MGGVAAEVSFDPNTCSLMAWNECPGSGSTKCDSSPNLTRLELGSVVLMGLDSDPSTPFISGFSFFIHPSMWSNDRFSITNTTTVFIGLAAAAEECRRRRKRKRSNDAIDEDFCISREDD